MLRNSKYPLMALGASLTLIVAFAISSSGPAYTQSGNQSGPNVRVINTPAEPVPVTNVDNPPREYVHTTLANNGYVVPAGKRLVIEHISGSIVLTNAELTVVGVTTTLGGVKVVHKFPATLMGVDSTLRFFSLAGQGPLYADAETSVSYAIGRIPSNVPNNFELEITISGYLIHSP